MTHAYKQEKRRDAILSYKQPNTKIAILLMSSEDVYLGYCFVNLYVTIIFFSTSSMLYSLLSTERQRYWIKPVID